MSMYLSPANLAPVHHKDCIVADCQAIWTMYYHIPAGK